MGTGGDIILKAKGICKSYDKLEVMRDVNLEVTKGEVMAIVGPSGAGKSTLLQIIGTLDRPDNGTVSIAGEDNIYGLSDRRLAEFRNRHIGFVFQFHQLLPEFTLRENIEMPALIGGASRQEARLRADRLIDYLGLSDRVSHLPTQLSGGERQRGAVARALVNGPDIIFADEPSGSLDSHNRAELHKLFFDLRRDLGQTFVIVTHDDRLAADADRIITINDGKIINK